MNLAKASGRLARAGMFALMLGIAGAALMAGAEAQQRGFRVPGDCRQNLSRTVDLDDISDRTVLQNVAQQCAALPDRGGGIAFAQFYAGQANRILGEGAFDAGAATRTIADQARLTTALEQFGVAQGLARGDRELRRLAQLEIARVTRLLARPNKDRQRYADALALLNRIEGGQLDRAALFERGMNLIEQDQPGTDDDEQLDLALQDLQVFASRDEELRRPNRYVRYRGPFELALLAERLGKQVLARPRSLDNARQALTYFRYSEQAYDVLLGEGFSFSGADRERLYVDMGMLHLQRARLLGNSERAELECASGGDVRTLDAAERNFREALRIQSNAIDAHWGMGCSLLSRGSAAQAAANELRAAVALVEDSTPDLNLRRPRADYHVALARALGEIGDWSGAEASFARAIGFEASRARQASIHFEAARLYRAHGRDQRTVLPHLSAAIELQPDAAARVLRAEIMLVESEDPVTHQITLRTGLPAADRRLAQGDLTTALASAGNHQPRVNYILSLLEEQAQSDRTGRKAVDYATAAYRSDRSNRVYRRQACLTQIMFGITVQGESPCRAEQGPGYAEDLFYEGVFWLRDAYRSPRNNRVEDWALAINAFDRSLNDLGGGPGDMVEGQELGSLVAYGKRFAFYCMGADAANPQRPGDQESEGVRRVFGHRYRLPQCWG
ncbi:MAG: hypothetical protein ABL883_05145 [Terricaulis sp.]